MRLVIGVLLAASACRFSLPRDPVEEEVWELVWEDDFEGTELDLDNWTFDIGTGPPLTPEGWGNNELQYYTNRPENVDLNGEGFLRITARRESPPYEGAPWTSARLKSQGLQEFRYGRIAIRALAPVERGIWPALWMLGAEFGPGPDDTPWPLVGEIDIMEVFGERTIGVALHGPGYAGGDALGYTYAASTPEFARDFHIFEVIWDPEHIVWAIDGDVVATVTPGDLPPGAVWVFDQPFFLILNVAVGGNTVNPPDATTEDPSRLVVDWIRVWQRREPLRPRIPVDSGLVVEDP